MSANTLFLRLEGPLQAWGSEQSKFVIRRTAEAPTKSGVIGILCAARGISRAEAPSVWLPKLAALRMGVRIDLPGERWWDYHTVAPGTRTAGGGTKKDAVLTRREYLCDASFLVALMGEPSLIEILRDALEHPKWTPYLGRKCCPPSRPLLEKPATGEFEKLLSALKWLPWHPRYKGNTPREFADCLMDWEPTSEEPEAPNNALIWYDVPKSFDPPSHEARFVIRKQLAVGIEGGVDIGDALQNATPSPDRPRTDYDKSTWGAIRDRRLDQDYHLCVFCKSPATTGQHISYHRASKEDNLAALADEKIMQQHLKQVRALCRLCHDAVTMIEYGLGMGLDRINPEDPQWRDRIIEKRDEIVAFRSLETRRRRLAAEEVE